VTWGQPKDCTSDYHLCATTANFPGGGAKMQSLFTAYLLAKIFSLLFFSAFMQEFSHLKSNNVLHNGLKLVAVLG